MWNVMDAWCVALAQLAWCRGAVFEEDGTGAGAGTGTYKAETERWWRWVGLCF